MKLAFVFVGGSREPWLEELSAEYVKKLGYFCSTEIIRIKPSRQARASAEQKLAEETADILKVVKKDDLLVVCDERGDSVSSKKYSGKLVKLFERGRPRVVILVGGAFGFGTEVRERADWTWSLSELTFNHHIAQAVVLEQTYRAFAIWKNLPYHNE
jgi:23S rRNA (pseudouridine1915-N3)-methyltransferase